MSTVGERPGPEASHPSPPDIATAGPTSLVDAPPPRAGQDLSPEEAESYVRAAVHMDRRPGRVLVVCHPLRLYKAPRGLLDALAARGFDIDLVETHPERVQSVRQIRDAFLRGAAFNGPLDVLVISGDGSLDHHVLIAAFWAFFPEMVTERQGEISCDGVTDQDLARLPAPYGAELFRERPRFDRIEATTATVQEVWRLRNRLDGLIRKGKSVGRLLRHCDRDTADPLFRFAVLGCLLPHKVRLRPHGFDLSGLARATQESTFQGLYSFVRSIACYPAGTAADNAVYAGTPGWLYAQASKLLTRVKALEGLRQWWESRVIDQFLAFYTRESVVVPARFSLVAFDGDWQLISSHAAGGPGAGHFFSADLSSKTKGLMGYLARIPQVIWQEGIFGSTIVRLSAFHADGRLRSRSETHMAEGLYTNRTFVAGVGTAPSTNPTSFAGQSTLIIIPPIVKRDEGGGITFRGVGSFWEAIAKGILARVLHGVGLGVGTLAGGGKLSIAWPEHQVTVKEGEELDLRYLDLDRKPRFVPTQVSGDPFQASRMTIRVAWGPLPMLAQDRSLLLAAARRSLAHLRIEQSYRLRRIFIGGLSYYRHRTGERWTSDFSARTGLFRPPYALDLRLPRAQQDLIEGWQALATGEFVDTTEKGLQLGRRGRYAHNNDQTAHLVLVRESRSTLLVRQVRAMGDDIFECRTEYKAFGVRWVIHKSQTRLWRPGQNAEILRETHYFRSAQALQTDAPTFFPFIARQGESPALPAIRPNEALDDPFTR